MRRLWLPILLLVALVRPAAAAHRCGNDVDGHPAPCACGDLLVSSRTLGPADRVTREHCPADGLFVMASGPVTLALNGRTIQGEGQGTGILVLHGRLTLAGPGTVEGFATGLAAHGQGALASASGMRFAGNRLDGVSVVGDGFVIQSSAAEDNGRDGFVLGGNGYGLDDDRARRNGRYGFHLSGTGAQVGSALGTLAEANHMAGFMVRGMMHTFVGATAVANESDGIYLWVMKTHLVGLRADANQGDGVRAMGKLITIANSSATANRGLGIWVMGTGAGDDGGNHGADNAGFAGDTDVRPKAPAGNPELVQCRVGAASVCR